MLRNKVNLQDNKLVKKPLRLIYCQHIIYKLCVYQAGYIFRLGTLWVTPVVHSDKRVN